MESNKEIVGQMVMDMFYQNYKTNSDYFDLPEFTSFVGLAWAAILLKEYEQQYAMERSEGKGELTFVTFPIDLLTSIELPVEKQGKKRITKFPEGMRVMGFKWDNQAVGIQSINPIDCDECDEFIRVSIEAGWELCYLPTTNKTFWKPIVNGLQYYGDRIPSKVDIAYVPAADDENMNIPDTRQMDAIQMALQLFIAAKDGKIIPKVNDDNPNKIIQTEADLQSIKQ